MKDDGSTTTAFTFEDILWHDTVIYGFAFNPSKFEFCLDIDEISEWKLSKSGNKYHFTLQPINLVFGNIYDVSFDISGAQSIVVDEATATATGKQFQGKDEYLCEIHTFSGTISFIASVFTKICRGKPIISSQQNIGLTERGGIKIIWPEQTKT